MQRGSKTLFADIFETVPEVVVQRKGRSEYFHARRNELLVDRYYFLAKSTEKRYDKLLERLSNEFFLSTYTIPEIIDANYAQLVKLKKEAPPEAYFKKKWPHLVW